MRHVSLNSGPGASVLRYCFTVIAALMLLSYPVNAQVISDHNVRFTWGAEAGSSIDLSANDMSSIDFNAGFGLSYRWIQLAGVGAAAHIMVSNSCRSYPVYAIVRVPFSPRYDLLFADVRAGVSLNYLDHNVSQTRPYAAVGIGINLAKGHTFRSYIFAGYTFMGRSDIIDGEIFRQYHDVHLATVKLGIAF